MDKIKLNYYNNPSVYNVLSFLKARLGRTPEYYG